MIALILRNRSYKKGLERVKTSIMENNPNITVEQANEIVDAIVKQDEIEQQLRVSET